MKQTKQHLGLVALVLAGVLTACGGGSSNGNTNPGGTTPGTNPGTTNPGTNPGGNTGYRAKLMACPLTSPTSDATASSCLAGTYSGTTPTGAACSMTINSNGSYVYTSPQLSATVNTNGQEVRTYAHTNLSNNHVLSWLMTGDYDTNTQDNYYTDTSYDMSFQAQFGANTTNRLDINVTKTVSQPSQSNTGSTCAIPL